jgi:hypothetical protein
MRSSFSWRSVDREGAAIPWFSYPAVEYLEGLDLSGCRLFEYGSGFSTIYWGRRVQRVDAVEDDAEWRDRIQPQLSGNTTVTFARSSGEYPRAIAASGAKYDIIVIDGTVRLECAHEAVSHLAEGGFMILDDADDFTQATELLRNAGLLQVDFAGFNPINSYTKTTSFFFHRAFKPKLRGAALPMHSLCHPQRNRGSSLAAT